MPAGQTKAAEGSSFDRLGSIAFFEFVESQPSTFWIFAISVKLPAEKQCNRPHYWVSNVKMIIAVIQPTKLRAVKQALFQAGVTRVTVLDSQEFAQHVGRKPVYRDLEYRTDILRKISLEIAVNDDFLDRTIEIIQHVAKTGTHGSGDGKIFVMDMEQAIQFSPEIRGPGAI